MNLPRGWAKATIFEIAETKLGKMLDAAKNKGAPVAYLRNVNVRWGEFDLSDLLEMRATATELSDLEVRDGDVFVCEGGEPGRCAVWHHGQRKLIFQKALHRVRVLDEIQPEYFSRYVRYFASLHEFSEFLTGTTIKHLPQVALQRISIEVPPAAEQRRIVAKLDALFARLARARAELDRIPVLAENLRLGALRAIFHFRGDEKELPIGWSFKRVDEIGDVQLGRQRSPKDHDGPHMRPYVRAANVTWSGWDLSGVKEMNFSPSEFETFRLARGDVVLNEGSGSAKEVGKPVVWNEEIENACFQNTLLRIRPHGYNSDLLRYCLLYVARSGQFISNTQGVNIIHIGKAGLARTIIPVPPLGQQESLVKILNDTFARADRLEAEAARARALLDRLEAAILTKAFKGELVPQDTNDEPASVLLDRIRAQRAAAAPAAKTKRGRHLDSVAG